MKKLGLLILLLINLVFSISIFGEEESLIGKSVFVWKVSDQYDADGHQIVNKHHGVLEKIENDILSLTVQGHPITKTIVLKEWVSIEQAEDPTWRDYLYLRDLDLTIETLESRGMKYLTQGFPYGGMDFLNRAGLKRYQINRQPSKYVTQEMVKRGRHWSFAYKKWMTNIEEKLASGMILYRGQLIRPGEEARIDREIEAWKRAKAEQKVREEFKKKWLTPKKLTEAEEIELRDMARIQQNFSDIEQIERCIADHKNAIVEAENDKMREIYYQAFNSFYYIHKFIIELKSKQDKGQKAGQPPGDPPWRIRFGIERK